MAPKIVLNDQRLQKISRHEFHSYDIYENAVLVDKPLLSYLQNFYDKRKDFEDFLKNSWDWFCKLKTSSSPCIYVVTRNNKSSIDNFINTIKNTDWDERPVKVLEYIGGYHLKN